MPPPARRRETVSAEVPLFEVRALRVDYRTSRRVRLTAVREVSFELWPGRIFAVVGESGCGKTSLARAMLGLVAASGGSLCFRGRDLAGMSTRERRATQREIQHVFQDPAASLSPRRTVRQALEEPLALYRLGNRASRLRRIERVLDTVGLERDALRRFPHELSGGQRQRVALARALAPEPALIIADEPMSSLDVSVQARIIELLQRVRAETGVAFLLIAHDLAVVQQLADEVGVMYLGRMVERATAAALFRAPSHPYTRALMDAAAAGRGGTPRPSTLPGEPPSPLTPPPGCVFHTRCPRVMGRCGLDDPAEIRLGPEGEEPVAHRVRCHLWS
jgi:oligopeptide/dipeptide ABC transporter ATP-binding protein